MAKLCSDIQMKMIEGAGHFVHEEEAHHVNMIIWDYIRITNWLDERRRRPDLGQIVF